MQPVIAKDNMAAVIVCLICLIASPCLSLIGSEVARTTGRDMKYCDVELDYAPGCDETEQWEHTLPGAR